MKQGPVILHRDDGVVIVDKPPDVLTSGGHDAMDGILSRFLEEEDGEKPQYLTHCHQLDAPTSGTCCSLMSCHNIARPGTNHAVLQGCCALRSQRQPPGRSVQALRAAIRGRCTGRWSRATLRPVSICMTLPLPLAPPIRGATGRCLERRLTQYVQQCARHA